MNMTYGKRKGGAAETESQAKRDRVVRPAACEQPWSRTLNPSAAPQRDTLTHEPSPSAQKENHDWGVLPVRKTSL